MSEPAPVTDAVRAIEDAAREGGWGLAGAASRPGSFYRQFVRGVPLVNPQSVKVTFSPTSGQLMSALVIMRVEEGPFTVSGRGLTGVVCRLLRREWS